MVSDLRAIFASDWAASTGEELPYMNETKVTDGMRGTVAGFGPTDALERGSLTLCGLVGLARERLWITTPYLVPHTDLATALQLASLRGVDVRILIPAPAHNILAWYASRNAAMTLREAGIGVWEYHPGFMHSKVMLIDDDLASVGTVNFDIRSALLNYEQSVLVENTDFAARVEEMLQRDFSRSEPLPDPLPAHVRYLAPVARLVGPLL
jgi:cardiolipin synthase